MPLHAPCSYFAHLSWRINSNFHVHKKPEVRTLFLYQATTTMGRRAKYLTIVERCKAARSHEKAYLATPL
jgi:hypothetical protein